MRRNLLNKKFNSIVKCQQTFIQSLEGVGDILVFETKKKKNKFVIENLKEVYNLFESFFTIKKNDPEKFEKLLLIQEYFDLYKNNKEEAGLRLAFYSEKYLVGFSSIIDQIVRIHEAAILSGNDEISRYAVAHINHALEVITSSPDNGIFIEQILRTLSRIGRSAIKHDDRSAYLALIDWYTHIVFNILEKENLQLVYLKTLDGYFFGNIQYIVSNGKASLFHHLVSSLVNNLHISNYNDTYEYAHTFMHANFHKYNLLDKELEIEKKVQELEDLYRDIFSKEILDDWLNKFKNLKNILENNFPEIERNKLEKIENKVRSSAISKFKYNNLLEITFAVGAYCVFKEKYELIKYLWEYKQPPDADASWVGQDIIPENLEDSIRFYFRKGYFEKEIDFQEDHRGSERYRKLYFLLLLSRYLRNISSSEDGQYPQINDFRLPDFSAGRLSGIEYEANDFLGLLKDFMNERKLLFIMGFDNNNLEELEQKIILFFDVIKKKAKLNLEIKHRNQDISLEKVDEFKNKFVVSFYEHANFRDIFKNFLKQYRETLDKYGGEHLGINRVDDKAIFFDKWHVHYADMGEHYGSNMAILEDAYLFNEVSKYCEGVFDLNSAIDKFDNLDEVFIIFSGVRNLFFENKNFQAKWNNDTKRLEIKGFEGRYEYRDRAIPVFEVNSSDNEDSILILNKNKFGDLCQYSPLDRESEDFIKDIFSVKIKAFSQDKFEMDKLLQTPPPWLAELKEKDKMVELLSTRALIQIFENYEFKKNTDFQGYCFKIRETKSTESLGRNVDN